jgi:hypothetical protein
MTEQRILPLVVTSADLSKTSIWYLKLVPPIAQDCDHWMDSVPSPLEIVARGWRRILGGFLYPHTYSGLVQSTQAVFGVFSMHRAPFSTLLVVNDGLTDAHTNRISRLLGYLYWWEISWPLGPMGLFQQP